MDTRTQMLELLQTRKPNFSLPQPFYIDPGFYQVDVEQIYYTQWLLAGPSCQIPKPGNYFTFNVASTSVLVVRGKDKEIRAFFNTCRHRGSRICTKEKGTAARLLCPYHQWTYELDGKLIFAGNMGDDFDTSEFPLKPVHCETVEGMVFVNLSPGKPPAIEPFVRDVSAYMAPHALAHCKVAHQSDSVESGNWKLVMENNRECYHCNGNHPELLRTLSEYDAADDPRINPEFAAKLTNMGERWDALELPNRPVNDPHKRYRAVRLPFEHGLSMTIDGQVGCKRLMGSITDPDLGSLRLLNLPNSWNHLQGDHAVIFRILPIGPQETLLTTWWLVHEDAREGEDYDIEHLTRVWNATNDQDRRVVEENQRGINSMAYEPGPYSPAIEMGVQSFIDWYTTEMKDQLGDSGSRLKVAAG
jgi:Rieske 2Fe-2S family protein